MFESILLICTGNICRSPIADRILLRAFPQKKITSVGLEALVGYSADATAARVAATMGICLAGHTVRSFDITEANKHALLLVMEQSQLEKISLMAPELRGKVMLLGRWNGNRDIPDPYKKSDAAFESVLNLIALACEQWANKLSIQNSGNKDDHNNDQ